MVSRHASTPAVQDGPFAVLGPGQDAVRRVPRSPIVVSTSTWPSGLIEIWNRSIPRGAGPAMYSPITL